MSTSVPEEEDRARENTVDLEDDAAQADLPEAMDQWNTAEDIVNIEDDEPVLSDEQSLEHARLTGAAGNPKGHTQNDLEGSPSIAETLSTPDDTPSVQVRDLHYK